MKNLTHIGLHSVRCNVYSNFRRDVIEKLCELVDVNGNADAWWDVPLSSMIEDQTVSEEYEKGKVRTIFSSKLFLAYVLIYCFPL